MAADLEVGGGGAGGQEGGNAGWETVMLTQVRDGAGDKFRTGTWTAVVSAVLEAEPARWDLVMPSQPCDCS